MPAAKKCPRCSAECTCRKKRRKPRVGRAARSKPMYMPPPTQNIFYGSTPAAQQALQFRPEVMPVPKLSFDMMTQTEAVAPPRAAGIPGPPAGSPPLRARPRVAPERASMEVQTDEITLPMARGEIPLRELERQIGEGRTLSLRPSTYAPRQPESPKTAEELEQMATVLSVRAAAAREREAPPPVITAAEAARLPVASGPGALQKMMADELLYSLARQKERGFETASVAGSDPGGMSRRQSIATVATEPLSVYGGAAAGGGERKPKYVKVYTDEYLAAQREEEEREARVREAMAAGGAAGGGPSRQQVVLEEAQRIRGSAPGPITGAMIREAARRKPKVAPGAMSTVPEEGES